MPTPFYTYVYYHGDKWEQYGDERIRRMFAHRSFLDHGINVAGASDYVAKPVNTDQLLSLVRMWLHR